MDFRSAVSHHETGSHFSKQPSPILRGRYLSRDIFGVPFLLLSSIEKSIGVASYLSLVRFGRLPCSAGAAAPFNRRQSPKHSGGGYQVRRQFPFPEISLHRC